MTHLADFPELKHYDVMRGVVRDFQIASYLEVGVQEGGSLRSVLDVQPRNIQRLALCDTWGDVHGGTNRGSHDHISQMLTHAQFHGFVKWFDCPSSVMWPELTQHYDLILIDADHSEACTYEDLTEAWKFCDQVLVQHDIFMPEVAAALARFLGEHPETLVLRFTGDTGTAVMIRTDKRRQ
jgi:hypothetical protein